MSDINSSTTTRRIQADLLGEQSQKLEALGPGEIIRWAAETFEDGRIAMLSAFQKAGCVLCHKIASLGLNDVIDVIFVDTGVNYAETLETVERMRDAYGLRIRTLKPKRTMAEQTRDEGVLYLSKAGQERCCFLRKKEPLQQIKGEYEAMLSSLHRSAGGRRKHTPILALDTELNLVRVHPFVNMDDEEIEAYIQKHGVIYNPLHDQGYPTVSCNRCTTPVLAGEDERAGRWRHLENEAVYCNINPTDRARGGDNSEFVELSYDTVEKILHFDI